MMRWLLASPQLVKRWREEWTKRALVWKKCGVMLRHFQISKSSFPNISSVTKQVRNHFLVVPMIALFHLFHEFGAHQFRAASHTAIGFDAAVEALHEIVWL